MSIRKKIKLNSLGDYTKALALLEDSEANVYIKHMKRLLISADNISEQLRRKLEAIGAVITDDVAQVPGRVTQPWSLWLFRIIAFVFLCALALSCYFFTAGMRLSAGTAVADVWWAPAAVGTVVFVTGVAILTQLDFLFKQKS